MPMSYRTIYACYEPDDHTVLRYIGQTQFEMVDRLRGHRSPAVVDERGGWFRWTYRNEKVPHVVELQTVRAKTDDQCHEKALQAEAEWIASLAPVSPCILNKRWRRWWMARAGVPEQAQKRYSKALSLATTPWSRMGVFTGWSWTENGQERIEQELENYPSCQGRYDKLWRTIRQGERMAAAMESMYPAISVRSVPRDVPPPVPELAGDHYGYRTLTLRRRRLRSVRLRRRMLRHAPE